MVRQGTMLYFGAIAAVFLLSARSSAAQEVPRITASFDSVPIAEVVASFAEVSGRSIIVGRGVEAHVTAEFHDVPWRVAFEEVLLAHGLAAIEDSSGVITVIRQVRPHLTTPSAAGGQRPAVKGCSVKRTGQGGLAADERGETRWVFGPPPPIHHNRGPEPPSCPAGNGPPVRQSAGPPGVAR
jgi:hypothetical protein